MSKVVRSTSSLEYAPIEHENWWREYVRYSKFNRQGLDIVCASFEHRNPVGCIVLVTGWNETFLKYADIIRNLFLHNYSVYTYDHQSQGLSGRWLVEPQSTWVHSFDDYVDDFVYYLTKVGRENTSRQIFVIAHDLGCLISAIGMSRHPLIVSRAVFTSPLIRNKCGMKYFDYRHPFPQPLAYWIAYLASYCGLGSSHFIGSFKERAVDKVALRLTSDSTQLRNWEELRFRYPSIISPCITNDWLVHCIRAQNKFSRIYELFRTNTLILQASDDAFVYNRAISLFARKAPAVRLLFPGRGRLYILSPSNHHYLSVLSLFHRIFTVPDSFHDLLHESPEKRNACSRLILNYFSSSTDDVQKVPPIPPLLQVDETQHIFTWPEIMFRAVGLSVSAVGFVFGISLMVGSERFLTSEGRR